jgi:hypothetical protein
MQRLGEVLDMRHRLLVGSRAVVERPLIPARSPIRSRLQHQVEWRCPRDVSMPGEPQSQHLELLFGGDQPVRCQASRILCDRWSRCGDNVMHCVRYSTWGPVVARDPRELLEQLVV